MWSLIDVRSASIARNMETFRGKSARKSQCDKSGEHNKVRESFPEFLVQLFKRKKERKKERKKDGELDVHFHAIGVFVVHFCCLRAWSPRQVHNTSFLKKRCQTSEAFKYWAVFGYSQSQSPTCAQRCMSHYMDRFLRFNGFWLCFLEFHASQNMTTSRHGVRLEKLIVAVR